MSILRPIGIEVAYLRVIEETIAESASLQSPAVLEQLKLRWIEKLQERLGSQKQATIPPSPVAGQLDKYTTPLSTSETPGVQDLTGKLDCTTQSHKFPTLSAIPTSVSYDKSNNTKVVLSTSSVPVDEKINCGLKVTEKTEDCAASIPVAEPYDAKTYLSPCLDTNGGVTAEIQSSEHPNSIPPLSTNEDEEDDWDSAEWKAVEPAMDTTTRTMGTVSDTASLSLPDSDSGGHNLSQPDTNNANITDTTASPTDTSSQQAKLPRQTKERLGEKGRGVVVESQTELYDDEENINEEDLSELEDCDPEYSDIVVSQFESVQRPHARKSAHKGQWRIKLRHGILQIDGKELLFNTMAGDLNF